MNKKVIITGTKGFIGSNLREELDSGYQIVEINEDILDLPDWTEKIQDFFKEDISAVFHIGACSDTLEQDVNYMMTVNYEFTHLLSDLCSSNEVPLIYSSSAANIISFLKYKYMHLNWNCLEN